MKTYQPSEVSSENISTTIWKSLAQIVGFAALTAVCAKAQIYLSFTPVPITLQTLAVVLSGAMLGPKKGALSQLTLIGFCLAGIPVFASPVAGFLVLTGPTAGYIFGFVISAYLAGYLSQQKFAQTWLMRILVCFASSLVIFVPGLLWLGVLTHKSFSDLLVIGFYPYLIGDALKAIVAGSFLTGIKK